MSSTFANTVKCYISKVTFDIGSCTCLSALNVNKSHVLIKLFLVCLFKPVYMFTCVCPWGRCHSKCVFSNWTVCVFCFCLRRVCAPAACAQVSSWKLLSETHRSGLAPHIHVHLYIHVQVQVQVWHGDIVTWLQDPLSRYMQLHLSPALSQPLPFLFFNLFTALFQVPLPFSLNRIPSVFKSFYLSFICFSAPSLSVFFIALSSPSASSVVCNW